MVFKYPCTLDIGLGVIIYSFLKDKLISKRIVAISEPSEY